MKRKRGELSNWQIIRDFAVQGAGLGYITGSILGALYPLIYAGTLWGIFLFPVGFLCGGIVGVSAGFGTGILMGFFTAQPIAMTKSQYTLLMVTMGFASTLFFGWMGFDALSTATDRMGYLYEVMYPTAIASVASLFVSNYIVNWWLNEGEKKKNESVADLRYTEHQS